VYGVQVCSELHYTKQHGTRGQKKGVRMTLMTIYHCPVCKCDKQVLSMGDNLTSDIPPQCCNTYMQTQAVWKLVYQAGV
jgi:hypothetical protein